MIAWKGRLTISGFDRPMILLISFIKNESWELTYQRQRDLNRVDGLYSLSTLGYLLYHVRRLG
jgi:hypothetical protein